MFLPGCGCCSGCLAGVCCCAPCTQPPSEITIEIIPGTPVPGPTLPMIRNTGTTDYVYWQDSQRCARMSYTGAPSGAETVYFSNPSNGTGHLVVRLYIGGLYWIFDNYSGNSTTTVFAETRLEQKTATVQYSMDSGSTMPQEAIDAAVAFLSQKRVLYTGWGALARNVLQIGNESGWRYYGSFSGFRFGAALSCNSMIYEADGRFTESYSTENTVGGAGFWSSVPNTPHSSATQPYGFNDPWFAGVTPFGMSALMGCASGSNTQAIPTGSGEIDSGTGVLRVWVSYTRWKMEQVVVDKKTTPNPTPPHAGGFFVGQPYRNDGKTTNSQYGLDVATSVNPCNPSRYDTTIMEGANATAQAAGIDTTVPGGGFNQDGSWKEWLSQAWTSWMSAQRDSCIDAGNCDRYYTYTEVYPTIEIGYVDFPEAQLRTSPGKLTGAINPSPYIGPCSCWPTLPSTITVSLSADSVSQDSGTTLSSTTAFLNALNATIVLTRRTEPVNGNNANRVAYYAAGPTGGPSGSLNSDCPWDGTYFAVLDMACSTASIRAGLFQPYGDGWYDTKTATEIKIDGFYLGGVDFSGAIGASVNALCSGTKHFELSVGSVSLTAVNYDISPWWLGEVGLTASNLKISVDFP